MISPQLRFIARVGLVAALVLVALTLPALAPAQARSPKLLLQDTPYPYPDQPTPGSGYPGPEQGVTPGDDYPAPGQGETPAPAVTDTPPVPLAPSPEAVLTQETEPGGVQDTPAPAGSPVATLTSPAVQALTPGLTGTAIVTGTPAMAGTLAATANPSNDGFQIDWGFFWMGFAIPVLIACGFVLYLLDRRPDLFTPRSKS